MVYFSPKSKRHWKMLLISWGYDMIPCMFSRRTGKLLKPCFEVKLRVSSRCISFLGLLIKVWRNLCIPKLWSCKVWSCLAGCLRLHANCWEYKLGQVPVKVLWLTRSTWRWKGVKEFKKFSILATMEENKQSNRLYFVWPCRYLLSINFCLVFFWAEGNCRKELKEKG